MKIAPKILAKNQPIITFEITKSHNINASWYYTLRTLYQRASRVHLDTASGIKKEGAKNIPSQAGYDIRAASKVSKKQKEVAQRPRKEKPQRA